MSNSLIFIRKILFENKYEFKIFCHENKFIKKEGNMTDSRCLSYLLLQFFLKVFDNENGTLKLAFEVEERQTCGAY